MGFKNLGRSDFEKRFMAPADKCNEPPRHPRIGLLAESVPKSILVYPIYL